MSCMANLVGTTERVPYIPVNLDVREMRLRTAQIAMSRLWMRNRGVSITPSATGTVSCSLSEAACSFVHKPVRNVDRQSDHSNNNA